MDSQLQVDIDRGPMSPFEQTVSLLEQSKNC